MRRGQVAQPLLRPRRLEVERLRTRVVDPRPAHRGLHEGDVDVVRAGRVRSAGQRQDQLPVSGLAVDGEQIAGPIARHDPDDGAGVPLEGSVVEQRRAIYTRRVHRYTDQTEELAKAILAYTTSRLRMDPVPLDGPKSSAELTASPARPSPRTEWAARRR